MPDSIPAPGYERLTVYMDIESELLDSMDSNKLASMVTEAASQKIKDMIEERKSA